MNTRKKESSEIELDLIVFVCYRVRYEFNRPFLEAKEYQDNDALAVEATGYALLSIFMMEGGGITFTQEKIVQWLNTMRLGDGGFISTVDTIVALQALVLYSYHSRIKVKRSDNSLRAYQCQWNSTPAHRILPIYKLT